MKTLTRHSVWSCCVLFGLAAAPVMGARMMLLPAGVLPGDVTTWPYTYTATGGETIEVDVWAEDTDPDAVSLWQVQMPCIAGGGEGGYVEFTSRTLDEARADYIFLGLTTLGLGGSDGSCPGGGLPGDPFTDAPVSGTLVLVGTPPVLTAPKYVCTWTFTASNTAAGLFTLAPVCYNGDPYHDCSAELTFLVKPNANTIPFTLEPLLIDVPVGQCCAGGICVGDFAEWDCLNNQGGTAWDPGKSCDTDACPCNTSPDCDDSDVCNGIETCNVGTHTCVPGTPLECDDVNECTDDGCDSVSGCQNPPSAANEPCGDTSSTDCTNPDTCDGAGNCEDNHASAGDACGDPGDTDCTNPDTCDGNGGCELNDMPDSTPCDDQAFCTSDETCNAGICEGGVPNECDDAVSCTTDSCDENGDVCINDLNPGICLIGNTCYLEGEANPANECEVCDTAQSTSSWSARPDESPCSEDQDDCTDDVCLAGLCEHPFSDSGTSCDDGDPCTSDDVCDGAGECAGTPDPNCNESCLDAVQVFQGTIAATNESAVAPDDAEASCQPDSNHDVWYFFDPTCHGEIFMSSSAIDPVDFDSVLTVFDACAGIEIACDDDSGAGLDAALTFYAFAGNRYFIRVAGFQEQVGSFELTIAPVNDCLIDGVCYADRDLNPENQCLACIPEVSTSQWTPMMEGSSCGDPRGEEFNECDNPDACDGNGVCELNHKPDGTTCSDEGNDCTINECSTGVCVHPPEPGGTPCGDPNDSDCDDPDTCDGAEACLNNYEPQGTTCGDPTETDCNGPDTCDGTGGCLDNLEPNGTTCTDDGNDCTDDACDLGTCDHPPLPVDTPCGNPSDSECDHPDTCNGLTTCLDNVDPDGLPCTDFEACTADDQCLSGVCVGLYEARVHGDVWPFGSIVPPCPVDATAEIGDGFANMLDVNCAFQAFNEGFPYAVCPCADVYDCDGGDGFINMLDVFSIFAAFNGDPWCPDPCPVGACCETDGSCTDRMWDVDCAAGSGVYQGHGARCDNVVCP